MKRMDNKIDLSVFSLMMLSDSFEDISSDLNKFNKHDCFFYYDESNNIRKLWLSEDDFNAPIDSDFVLGGVMHIGQLQNADFDELKEQLRLQKSVKELKFKHISKSKDFLGCMSEPKVILLLQWLYQSNLYVHYSNINNLYFAIVDIIDTIEESSFSPFSFQLKNELYKIAVANYPDFYQLLVEHNYPNIPPDSIALFYQQIIDFIDDIDDPSFEMELLRQCLKRGRKQNELVFLQDNPEKTILDNYFPFYLRPIGVFFKANHTFDNENCIESQFEKYELYYGDSSVDNYDFVDSKDNQLIQLSDCVVGLLGKYYTFVNRISQKEAYEMFETITPVQISTLRLFAQVIKKSEDLSKLLLHSSESFDEHDIGAFILNTALKVR